MQGNQKMGSPPGRLREPKRSKSASTLKLLKNKFNSIFGMM